MSKPVKYVMGEDSLQPPEDQKWTRYRVGGRTTTIETPEGLIKNARPFGSVERAVYAKGVYERQGWGGSPASASSCVSKVLEKAIDAGEMVHPRQAVPKSLRISTEGAVYLWIEQMIPPGSVPRGVWHYDVNEAFWSALKQGLPAHFAPYRTGDDRWVGRVEIKSSKMDLPWFWEKRDFAVLTGTDVRYYGMDVEVKEAITYEDRSVDMAGVMKRVEDLFGEWIGKRARQQSWGLFAMQEGAVRAANYDAEGKQKNEWTMPARWRCHPWAVIITRRVMRKVHAAIRRGSGISCFVDSILAREPIPTGEEAGTWRKEGHYPRGIYIESPGVWTGRPRPTKRPSSRWTKHAGIEEEGNAWRPDVATGGIEPEEALASVPARTGLGSYGTREIEHLEWGGVVDIEWQPETTAKQSFYEDRIYGGGGEGGSDDEKEPDSLSPTNEAPF
jgi:hypothetical protein